MKTWTSAVIGGLIMVAMGWGGARAGDGKFSGVMYGDYYYFVQHDSGGVQQQNGVWFRWIHFAYDQDLENGFAARLRFLVNGPGDFTSQKLTPFVKDAYLKWTTGDHAVQAGMFLTPTWKLVESHWGYRSVEKTPLDLQKGWGEATDVGLGAEGRVAEGRVAYHVVAANGEGVVSETNPFKKVYGAVTVTPVPLVQVQVYGDYTTAGEDRATATGQGFVALTRPAWRLGALYAVQGRGQGPGKATRTFALGSLHGAVRITERLWGFARADRLFDPNPSGDKIAYLPFRNDARATLVVAGLDRTLAKGVQMQPNVELVFYDEVGGSQPQATVVPRMTMLWRF